MFRKNLESFNSDLYAITETGCNESIHDGEIVPVGYHIIRCDRLDGRKQGGVLLVAAQPYCKFAQSNKVPNCMNRQLDLVLSSSSRGEVLVVASDEALVPVDVYHPPLVNQFGHDPKSFWSYCKSISSCAREEVILKNGNILTNVECAREFAAFFRSVYTSEPPQLNVNMAVKCASGEEYASTRVHIDAFSLKDVKEALASLKPKRSASRWDTGVSF
ncbi:unnamed protein product [Colias eurytheme]|nr:unnamed protein product [Colias eurytheme]